MKWAIRRTIAGVVPAAAEGGTRVLLYHSVDEPEPADRMSLRVSRQTFLEQMAVLRTDGYHVVPLVSVLNSKARDDRPRVAITFDDGYRSQVWAAAVLRDFGFPATFFVVPRFLDGARDPTAYWEQWGHLDWDDLPGLREGGAEVGAHSATHPDLRQCTADELGEEVSGAKRLLEDRLGEVIVSFSYPYGRHNSRVRMAVERAGYRLACTSRYGGNRTSGPCYFVHRTEVTGRDSLVDFRWKLQGKYDWLGYWQDVRPT